MGEHNDYVYRELLKLSAAEIAVLRAEGHIGMDFLGGRSQMPAIPEYEIHAMKYAERQTDLSTFMLASSPVARRSASTISSGFCRGDLSLVVVDTGFTPRTVRASPI